MSKKKNKNIILQSNLCSEIIYRDILRKEKIKEEQRSLEEKEADENYAIYGYRYVSAFMKEHKQDYIDGKMHGYRYSEYTSSYNNSSYYDNDYCVIYLYKESSSIVLDRTFFSYTNFFAYCSDNDIELDEITKNNIRNMATVYCIYDSNTKNLLFSYNFDMMCNKFEKEFTDK